MSKVTDELVRCYSEGEYFEPHRGLRISKDDEIFLNNVCLGKFYCGQTDFLLLSDSEFKTMPAFTRYKKELARSAEKYGYYVIITNTIDPTEFGSVLCKPDCIYDDCANTLVKYARYSIGTQSAIILFDTGFMISSYGHFSSDGYITPVEVLCDYLSALDEDYALEELGAPIKCYSMLELLYTELKPLCCDYDIRCIEYCIKRRIHSAQYIELTNDITGRVGRMTDKPRVHYGRTFNNKVYKYYGGTL